MSKSEKGKKGFQTKEKEEIKNKRIVSYLNEKELIKFKEYCNYKNEKMSIIIRQLILDKLPD
jgi:hypothetical protein|tara:strand:- start:7 stop:192 length:186 start_codon:yes stop_codon:yes gene_type:complete